MRKLTINQVKEKLFAVHGNIVSLDENTYKDTRKMCKFIDSEFGDFYNNFDNIVNKKQKHPQRSLLQCSLKLRMDVNDIIGKIYDVHKDEVSLDKSTYVKTHKKCRFIDKTYGEFYAYPYNVIYRGDAHPCKRAANQSKTFFKKYGVSRPIQNKDIAMKCAKSSNNSCILFHWKTRTRTCLCWFL